MRKKRFVRSGLKIWVAATSFWLMVFAVCLVIVVGSGWYMYVLDRPLGSGVLQLLLVLSIFTVFVLPIRVYQNSKQVLSRVLAPACLDDPRDALNTYYQALLLDRHYAKAYHCLTAAAQDSFGDLQGFVRYWRTHDSDSAYRVHTVHGRHTYLALKVSIVQREAERVFASVDIPCVLLGTFEFRVYDAPYAVTQRSELVKQDGNWLLTDGTGWRDDQVRKASG